MASWNEKNDKDKESSHLKWKQLTGGQQVVFIIKRMQAYEWIVSLLLF